MINILIPQSNSNDTEVFIAEWKFKNNDLVKKGEHLFSVETSKVVEEITAEETGYLKIKSEKGSRVQIGDTVGFISKNKTDVKVKNTESENQMIFTKKAEKLIAENKLNKNIFKNDKIVNESVVKKYLDKNIKDNQDIKYKNQLIILIKENQPYHACVYFKKHGIIDLSLLGSKIHKSEEYNFSNCNCIFFDLNISDIDKAISFYSQPALLTDKIIVKEKNSRGWSQKAESADYILNFRNKRSIKIEDMNCIEWLIRGLEVNGEDIPENILTASALLDWASSKLKQIKKADNLEIFHKLY